MNTIHITKIVIKALWDKYDIVWDNLDPRVNILVGKNGSGKSNLLRLVNALYGSAKEKLDIYNLIMFLV